ncbi:hypothetical protein NEOLEDRAFT_1180930 [Neolentinus lepideus HHB14362 ss-1]|uniref:Uncharacterized protein n=1 Tax=Neolentinus lepideus HHB14362 ss-1 TaxID=1314782 RepID=A0A165QEW4_9AGAM|nr:hypothetical protein NEOLEDRAFT_1180930 [Neolentinus lepideus HHB14362 ss-1]
MATDIFFNFASSAKLIKPVCGGKPKPKLSKPRVQMTCTQLDIEHDESHGGMEVCMRMRWQLVALGAWLVLSSTRQALSAIAYILEETERDERIAEITDAINEKISAGPDLAQKLGELIKKIEEIIKPLHESMVKQMTTAKAIHQTVGSYKEALLKGPGHDSHGALQRNTALDSQL